MGSLSYGELAGERMKLGLLLHDPEEEHDCFSDNTHISHLYDAVGIRNVYLGSYKRVDGSTVEGPSVQSLVKEADAAVDAELVGKLDATVAKMEAIRPAPSAAKPTTSRSARAMRRQRHRAGGDRCAGRPDQIDRAGRRRAQARRHRLRGFRQPRRARQGLPVSVKERLASHAARSPPASSRAEC
jgi:hypothetical protein